MKTPTSEIKVGALTLGGLIIFLLIISFLGSSVLWEAAINWMLFMMRLMV